MSGDGGPAGEGKPLESGKYAGCPLVQKSLKTFSQPGGGGPPLRAAIEQQRRRGDDRGFNSQTQPLSSASEPINNDKRHARQQTGTLPERYQTEVRRSQHA